MGLNYDKQRTSTVVDRKYAVPLYILVGYDTLQLTLGVEQTIYADVNIAVDII